MEKDISEIDMYILIAKLPTASKIASGIIRLNDTETELKLNWHWSFVCILYNMFSVIWNIQTFCLTFPSTLN